MPLFDRRITTDGDVYRLECRTHNSDNAWLPYATEYKTLAEAEMALAKYNASDSKNWVEVTPSHA